MEKKACLKCGTYITSDEDAGTNKDGSPNYDYCKNCYQNGSSIINTNVKDNDALLGVLLIMPFYLVIHLLFMRNNASIYYGFLLSLCRAVPIIIGVILSFSMYKKASRLMGTIVILLSLLSIWYTYDSEFIEHSGWDGFGPAFGIIISSVFARILSIAHYGKIVGGKKMFKYLLYSLAFSILSIVIIVVVNMGS